MLLMTINYVFCVLLRKKNILIIISLFPVTDFGFLLIHRVMDQFYLFTYIYLRYNKQASLSTNSYIFFSFSFSSCKRHYRLINGFGEEIKKMTRINGMFECDDIDLSLHILGVN